jgi:hypothetical protein
MKNKKDRINKIKSLAAHLGQEYRHDQNIVGIGWGFARRSTVLVPELCIIFHVKQKLSTEKAIMECGSSIIPKEIDGIRTDVKVFTNPQRQSAGSRNDKMYDPLIGGVASANLEQISRTFFSSHVSKGTLGILCRDAEGRSMALSNWHVWADDDAEIGDRIIQPSTPDGGTYAESITKVVGCGPLLSTVIEGRVPSPLSAGLYGGAAAAGALAALTDHKDPIIRGREMTNIQGGSFTHEELLDVSIAFPGTIPWPGHPFQTDVEWQYNRQTNSGDEIVEVTETQYNPQILLGQAVAPNKANYRPGENITLQAEIWDYQNRPSDAYHVLAHLIPESNTDFVIRMVLHSALCRPINLAPAFNETRYQNANPVRRNEDRICIRFGFLSPSAKYTDVASFGPLSIYNRANESLRVVQRSDNQRVAIQIPSEGLSLKNPPASQVIIRVSQFTDTPIQVIAFNNFGDIVAEAITPNQQNIIHELNLQGNLITHVIVTGGGGEGLAHSYCFNPQDGLNASTTIPNHLAEAYQNIDVPFLSIPRGGQLRAGKHCFRGQRRLPEQIPTGKWKIYLTVSNVNHTPLGTPPEEASVIIGGQELGGQSQALLCGFMLLGDHVFDIF